MRTTRFIAASTVVLLVFAWNPVASETSAAVVEGICPTLGCIGGETKCADGTLTYPGGQEVEYTCYTTIQPD